MWEKKPKIKFSLNPGLNCFDLELTSKNAIVTVNVNPDIITTSDVNSRSVPENYELFTKLALILQTHTFSIFTYTAE